ncbi:hypothetical protein HHI36_024417, partial [Cryptolaemus montrouzieri]
SLHEKIFANLMPEGEADEVLIIPQQNVSSDAASEFEADNEDGFQSSFEAPSSSNLQTLQNKISISNHQRLQMYYITKRMKNQTIKKMMMMKLTSIVTKTKMQMLIHP